ncbi:MAG TPA: hypothetical protein VJZ69_03655 [Clostridia bacterium]|nr:hypothetical protein [Clostridia bacterium]
MKKLLSKLKLKNCLFSALLASLCFCLLFCLYACNKDNSPTDANEGFTVSGQIVNCAGTLANVSVLKNGEEFFPSVYSNANGIFNAVGLSKDDVLSFRRYGYTFTPNAFIVIANYNSLNVFAASSGEGEDGSTDTGEDVAPKVLFSLNSNRPELVEDPSGTYDKNALISLSARETDGWRFSGWYQEDNLLQEGTSLNLSFILSSNATIDARFVEIPLSPTNTVWTEANDTLSWNECANATSYNVYVENELCQTLSSTSINLATYLLAGSNNKVSIEAVGNEVFNGRISHKSSLTIFYKNRILTAKNIGFLQFGDENSLVFTLNATSEMLNDGYGFYISILKDNALWEGSFALSALAVAPEATFLSLALEGDTQEGAHSLALATSRTLIQSVGDSSFLNIRISIDTMFDTFIPELICNYNPDTYLSSLSSLRDYGDYLFSITAITPSDKERNSEPSSATYSYTKQLNSATSLTLPEQPLSLENLILTFADTNQTALNVNPNTDTLFFEIYFNDVMVASIASSTCNLPPAKQSPTATHTIDLSSSAFLPYLPSSLSDLNSISICAVANGYMRSSPATIIT